MIRIKDIAEKAGVSVGTVDRVLHNRGEVKESTKEKVLSIANKLNYKPNLAARALKSPTKYKIGVILPNSDNNNLFWKKHPIGIKNACNNVYPYKIDLKFFYYEMHNPDDFNKCAKSLISWKPEGVIFAPILKKESALLCSNLDEKNIPYAFIDSYINNTNAITFVGEDPFRSGRVAASIADLGIDKDKDILIVNIVRNLDNIQHLNLRTQGFLSYFMDAGKNKGAKINIEVNSAARDIIKEKLDTIFTNNKNIGGVMVTGSRTYAIAEYLKSIHKENLFLIGYELYDRNIDLLHERIINFLINQRPIEQGEKVFNLLFNYITNKIVPNKKDFQQIDIINIENSIIGG